jgi:hypothetical protein
VARPREALFAQRLVLLGASNLTLGLPLVIDLARAACGGAVDVFTAQGLGRSYGMTSNVLGRTLSGILQSNLWAAIADRPPIPTAALVTDIGNDILYHVDPATIEAWVEQCIERLKPLAESIGMTTLPVCNIEGLGRKRFYFLRTLCFPSCRLSLTQVVDRAYALNERIAALAKRTRVCTIDPQANWYGFDAIHVTPRQWRVAWPIILEALPCSARESVAKAESKRSPPRPGVVQTFLDILRSGLWMLRPNDCRRLFGIELHARQPAAQLADGTQVSFY